ncbi:MAG: hypothetical protein Q7T49_01415 [bacterium]|nr:hypothetical protein [bacterium]
MSATIRGSGIGLGRGINCKKEIDMFTNWNFLGVFGAVVGELAVIIRNTMTRLGVSPSIIEWANTEKGRQAFEQAVETFAKAYQDFLAEANKLLEFVGTVTISATTGYFIAKEKFKLKKDGGICSYLGDNFKAWFGDKVEDPITKQTLRHAKLRQASVDSPIIAELGGEVKAETTLSELFSLMEK